VTEADHRMGEAGEEALRQCLRRRPAHDVIGLGARRGRCENQKRKRDAGEHFGNLPIRGGRLRRSPRPRKNFLPFLNPKRVLSEQALQVSAKVLQSVAVR
jgi:hypothetical protein